MYVYQTGRISLDVRGVSSLYVYMQDGLCGAGSGQLDGTECDTWAGWDLVHRDWSERAAFVRGGVRARAGWIAIAYAGMRRRVRRLRARPFVG